MSSCSKKQIEATIVLLGNYCMAMMNVKTKLLETRIKTEALFPSVCLCLEEVNMGAPTKAKCIIMNRNSTASINLCSICTITVCAK